MAKPIYLSVITPVFNEAGSLPSLISQLKKTLTKTSQKWEIIAVNDGSTDQSPAILNQLAKKEKKLKVIHFSRNFGQTPAIAAGLKSARGRVIVLIDADLQNKPEDIPKLLTKLEQGYDVVSGWRKNRQDPLVRSWFSQAANQIISLVTGIKIHDTGCSLKAYKSSFIKNLSLYGEMHRFIPALAAAYGAKITEVPVSHSPRQCGRSKYTLWRTFKVLLDLLTVKFLGSFSTKPIYVFGGSGFVLLALGLFASAFIVIRKIFFQGVWVSPMLFIAVLAYTVGVQMILMGLLAEIMIRSYFESSSKPTYRIKEKINLDNQ